MNPSSPTRHDRRRTGPRPQAAAVGLAWVVAAGAGWASPDLPPSCSSDGVRPPTLVLERFISADCGDCWTEPATPRPTDGAVALDWIVPGTQQEDAPLSAAASRDALLRLQTLNLSAPSTLSSAAQASLPVAGWILRVAHGQALRAPYLPDDPAVIKVAVAVRHHVGEQPVDDPQDR